MDVKKLPVEVQSILSASGHVNTYKRAVEELVYNSLDADSTSIAIRIHVEKNWMQVVDNGCGINKADYELLGEWYATSKLLDINTLKAAPSKYGYQGQALANIIEVSQMVKITSRSANTNETWVKTYVEGNKGQECFKIPMRPSKGTTVEINGFLFNQNIQKKLINAFNELQDIKTFLKQLTLVSNDVSISLRDDSENDIIFKMHKKRDIYQTLKSLFDLDINNIQELQVEKHEYKVKAYMGVEKTEIKQFHCIYLNNKFIQSSNLHKIINNKLGKPKYKNLRKDKITYNEDSVSQVFPFYFLFITCPYYEYDIITFGKTTTIEFKNWLHVNNLIEKLVKFYEGDVRPNDQITKSPLQVSTTCRNTKNEVTKIVEKILGRHNQIPRASQMQNGIKGKQAKRKRKKQAKEFPLSKIKIPPKSDVSYKDLKTVKEMPSKNDLMEHVTPKMTYLDKQLNHCKFKQTENKKNRVIKKIMKCKGNKNYSNIIKRLENNTHSLKRCSELSCYVDDLLNFNNYEKTKDISFTQKTSVRPMIQYIEDTRQDYDVNERQDFDKQRSIKNNPIYEIICSYDLLKTIIKTQQPCDNQNFKNKALSASQQPTCTKKLICNSSPKLTFESHKYNNLTNLNKKKELKFMSKKSRDNFNIHQDKFQRNFKVKTGNFLKPHGLCISRNKKNREIAEFNKLLNKYQMDIFETPFSIDLSGTDIIEFSKQIRNQIQDDMKLNLRDKDYNKICSGKSKLNCTEQLNIGVNINTESTYTILVDTYCDAPQAFSHRNSKCLNQTYLITTHDNKSHIKNTSKIILTSEPQHSYTLCSDALIEPLAICEAIINDPVEFEKFDKIHNIKDSLYKIENLNSIQSPEKQNVNRYSLHGSKHKTLNKEYEKAIPIDYNEDKNRTLKVNNEVVDAIIYINKDLSECEIQDDYNFKLNSRHNFLPKGMSQIFKNCFSKNICSYNLDTEYYENIIYTNFLRNVAVNSEIFEPKVQNMKESNTREVQKVGAKLNKHNANLTFGKDLLGKAKVIGQVDRKFIAAKIVHAHESAEFFVMFDQHAVHERIRLETNLSHYLNGDKWKKTKIKTISTKISKDEILYLHNHKGKFTRFGLEWTIVNGTEILVNGIPEAIRGREIPRPIETIVTTVKDLILEQIHAIKYLKGNITLYPRSIMNLVFSEACRYAVKFGDYLSINDCKNLITALSECNTPFQCAHGRPVMAVMMNLKKEKVEYKVNIKNIMRFKNKYK